MLNTFLFQTQASFLLKEHPVFVVAFSSTRDLLGVRQEAAAQAYFLSADTTFF